MTIEATQTLCQHADDLQRDISNAILKWERRNPGKTVMYVEADFREYDILAPHLMVRATIVSANE